MADTPIVKPIDWSEEKQPNDACFYDHINGSTPLGPIIITWKSWKDHPSYTIEDSTGYIGDESSIDEAKNMAFRRYEEVILNCIHKINSH